MNPALTELEAEALRLLVSRYSPAGFLVDSGYQIISFLGDTYAYLRPAPGRPSFHFTKMIDRELLPYVQAAMDAAATPDAPARDDKLEFDYRGMKMAVEAIPISTSAHRRMGFLILLHREKGDPGPAVQQVQSEWSRLRHAAGLMRHSVASLVEREHAVLDELEKRRAQLQDVRTDLQQIVGRMITDQEEDRKSIAGDLHDVFSQRLASLGLRLDALAVQAGQASPDIAAEIIAVKTTIEEFAEYVHHISRRLHPAFVAQFGLKAALTDECARWSEEQNIPVDCVIENVPDSLPETIGLAMYRVAQEALTNIAKYAFASGVKVRLRTADGVVTLSVEDSGQGFETSTVKKGLGLITMEERIRAVDGRFSVDSRPGRGTIVKAAIPLQ
jgi:signal transduction histidine kinase